MVQLRSFKLVEQEQNQQHCNESAPALVSVSTANKDNQANSRKSSSSTLSHSTLVGGNLTSCDDDEANSDKMQSALDQESPTREQDEQRSSSLDSNQEYQSAAHDILDEDERQRADEGAPEQQAPKTGVASQLEQGKLEDIVKQRAAAAAATFKDETAAVTRLCVERGSITNLAADSSSQNAPHKFAGPSIKQVAAGGNEAPRSPRIQLKMPRSQTSPSLSQLGHGSAAPKVASPLVTQGAPGTQSPATRRAHAAGDDTSQCSFGTQKNQSNHFEIRWHNVRLTARRNSRLANLFGDTGWWRRLRAVTGGGQQAVDTSDGASLKAPAQQGCYSPPMQHDIPPTIDEEVAGLEMLRAGRIASSQSIDTCKLELGAGQGSSSPGGASSSSDRCILDNISGQVFSGQMTAILGPSGVGKTTLLNSLTGRNTLDGSGRVSLIGATSRKRMSVVNVPQVDVLPGKLTTWEDLLFTSRLKNPQRKINHRHNIERIVKHLHMDKFLHTRIDKLSGGEQRRLSIARELLASPDIMTLDEPTSGLDANTCKKIITALRHIVEHSDNILDKPMCILVTIHQPQQEVYNLFHRVCVMAVGGRIIYEGPPAMLMPTLIENTSLARVTPVEQLNENPAIVAIEVASGEHGPQLINELANLHEAQVYEEFSYLGGPAALPGTFEFGTPQQTPRALRAPRNSPLSVSHFELMHTPTQQHRKRLNSLGNEPRLGRPTPIMAKRQLGASGAMQLDRVSSMTSLSYASSYDAELPEPTSKLKVDKRLRRSVVMKSNLLSHTWTLMQRCWLLTTRDMFLMGIRILGFLLVAGGMVQIFSHALDPHEHQCPQFETQVDDVFEYLGQVKQRLMGLESMLKQSNATHLFFFHLLLCITMVTSALTGLVFPLQMRMFIREYKNGWYSPASFVLSQTLAELPVDILGPLITLLITYPLCNQPTSAYYWRELGYILVVVLISIICKSQAQIVGAFLMDSVENSVFISCVAVTAPALLSGIPVRVSQMVAPLQIISYTSFLRFGFESLMSLRYGYDMCPCNQELVYGYPVSATERAVPAQLSSFVRGIIELNQPSIDNATTTIPMTTALSTQSIDAEHDNIILKFLRLITEAGNQMLSNAAELGDCNKYRSLYLLALNIPNDILPKWLAVMGLMFVVSRVLTYFAVKTVIKLR